MEDIEIIKWISNNKEILGILLPLLIFLISGLTSGIKAFMNLITNLFNRWVRKAYISKEDIDKLDKVEKKAIRGFVKYGVISLIINITFFIIIYINPLVSHVNTSAKIIIHILISILIVAIFIYYDVKKNSVDYSEYAIGFISIYCLFLFLVVRAYTDDKVVIFSYKIMSSVCVLMFLLNLFSSMIKILRKYSAPDSLDIYILNQEAPYKDIKVQNAKIHKNYITITVENKDKYSIVKRSKIEIPSTNIEKIVYKYYR